MFKRCSRFRCKNLFTIILGKYKNNIIILNLKFIHLQPRKENIMTEEEWEEYMRKVAFQAALEMTIENNPDVLQIPAMQDLENKIHLHLIL